jgi:integrase
LKDDPIYFPLFETLYYTGMREGELLALSKDMIDLENNIIHIRKTFFRRYKVDHITEPKTENSIRDIVIPQFLANELKEYLSHCYGLKDDERIFKLTAEAVQHKMKNVIRKLGLKMIRVHSLRHSHVAYLINRGVQPLEIKERLGHRDIKITLNTYGHLYPNAQKRVADLLDMEYKKTPANSND